MIAADLTNSLQLGLYCLERLHKEGQLPGEAPCSLYDLSQKAHPSARALPTCVLFGVVAEAQHMDEKQRDKCRALFESEPARDDPYTFYYLLACRGLARHIHLLHHLGVRRMSALHEKHINGRLHDLMQIVVVQDHQEHLKDHVAEFESFAALLTMLFNTFA